MYVEPCCIDNQLPRLLRQSDGHAAMFQTSGDVTLEHMIVALMPMVGDRPRVLTLALPVIDDDVAALLQRYMRLEWVAHLNLITSQPLSELQPQLERIGVAMDRITVAIVTDSTTLGLLVFTGASATAAVQGQLESSVRKGLHLYSALFAPTNTPAIRSLTDPITALIKARAVEIEPPKADDAATSEAMSEEEEDEQEPPAARSGRKKTSRTPKGQRLESDTETLT